MYTNYNMEMQKNQMLTPPIIGLTSSIVNDKLNNITLDDSNSAELFSVENEKISPVLPIIVEEPEEDDEVSNKKYVDDNFLNKNITELSLNNLNIKDNDNNTYTIDIYNTSVLRNYLRFNVNNNGIFYLSDNKIQVVPDLYFENNGIVFNRGLTNSYDANYPRGILKNLVPSTITETQITTLSTNNLLDNVVPTYNFCENNYLKTIPNELTVTNVKFKNNLTSNAFSLNVGLYDDTDYTGYLKLNLQSSNYLTLNSDLFHFKKYIGIIGNRGIYFNTDENNENPTINSLPTTYLRNLVTSTVTELQLSSLTNSNGGDSIVPTYNFCENTYVKKSSMKYKIYRPLTSSYKLENIKKIATGDNVLNLDNINELGTATYEYTIPDEINGYLKFVSIYCLVYSQNKNAISDLSCTINSSTTSDIMLGTTENAIYVGNFGSSHYAKFSLNYYLAGSSTNKIVLHFFYRTNSYDDEVLLYNYGSNNYTLNIKIACID